MIDFPPALVLIAGGVVLPFAPPRLRAALLLALPVAALAFVWSLPDGTAPPWQVHGYELAPVKVDALGRLFATIFAIMAFAGGLFALNQARTLELACALIYAGSAIGVALAGDLLTVFVFWELMALASTGVLIAAGGDGALRAAGRLLSTQPRNLGLREFSLSPDGGQCLLHLGHTRFSPCHIGPRATSTSESRCSACCPDVFAASALAARTAAVACSAARSSSAATSAACALSASRRTMSTRTA